MYGNKLKIEKDGAFIQALATIEAFEFAAPNQALPASAVALCGDMKIHVPLSDHINIEDEVKRLEKEKVKVEKDLDKTNKK